MLSLSTQVALDVDAFGALMLQEFSIDPLTFTPYNRFKTTVDQMLADVRKEIAASAITTSS